MKQTRKESKARRHRRVRGKVSGSTERPRLAIFRSNEQLASGANCTASTEVGKLIAKRSLEKGISRVVFDRGGNLYHGRVKSLADAAREAGLDF